MSNEEFSNGFDTLLASYAHKAIFGEQSSIADVAFDEYEKSFFLTLAQDQLLKAFYEGNANAGVQGFDESIRRQLDFSNLITKATITKVEDIDNNTISIDLSSLQALFILNERVITDKDSYVIVPISFKDYDRIESKSYSQPLKRQAWRLFGIDSNNIKGNADIILRHDAGEFKEYKIRYIRRPKPIILVDLEDSGLSINNEIHISQCELNPIIHEEILSSAVRLAMQSRNIETPEVKQLRKQNQNNNE